MSDNEEYLRRNLIVCKAVGIQSGLGAAITRLASHSRPPEWLMTILQNEYNKTRDVVSELAAHRNEVKP
ncbi:MAG: hypothetical protein ABIK28_18170 [Planctomycetota bacterium]